MNNTQLRIYATFAEYSMENCGMALILFHIAYLVAIDLSIFLVIGSLCLVYIFWLEYVPAFIWTFVSTSKPYIQLPSTGSANFYLANCIH